MTDLTITTVIHDMDSGYFMDPLVWTNRQLSAALLEKKKTDVRGYYPRTLPVTEDEAPRQVTMCVSGTLGPRCTVRTDIATEY